MSSQKIWLWVSLSSILTKKKKVKVILENDDYEAAFNGLKDTCIKQLRAHIKTGTELPELVMVYKPEDNLDGDSVALDDKDDLEGMLEAFPSGEGVRIFIQTEEFEDRSYFVGSTMQENLSKEKVSHYLENQLSRGAAATDSESEAYRSSRTSSPITSQPRKRQKSEANKSSSFQSSKAPTSSQDQHSVSPADYINQFGSSGKEGDSSAESIYPQDSTGSSSMVIIPRPDELPDDKVIETKYEGDESVVVLSYQSSQYSTDDATTDRVPVSPTAGWTPDMDRTVPLTSSTSCDTENTSFNPPLSTGSVKLLFEEEEKKTIEVAGEDTECPVKPPKPGEESMETVVDKDSIDVGEKTGAVQEGDVGDNEEENKEFVSCEKDSSPDKAIEDGSPPTVATQDKASQETDQKSVEETATKKNQDTSTSEGNDSGSTKTEAQGAPNNEIVPSVTQSGQLFSKDKDANSSAVVAPNETDDSKPDLEREMSAEERQLVLSEFGDSLQFSNAEDSPETVNPNLKNNMTYSPRMAKFEEDETYKRPGQNMTYSAILTSSQPSKRNKVGAFSEAIGAFKQTVSDTYSAVTEKIFREKINVCFIVHANVYKGQYLAVSYAVGGTKSQWKQKDCEEVIGESGSKVYRAVIANVPENARIFYKFFKYSPYVIVNNQLRADWEWLDRNQFTVDSHKNVNRVLNIQNESTTVYIAVSFNSYVPDSTRLKQYVSLIRVIESQNSTILDFCTQLDFFVIETLTAIPEALKLFKENFGNLMNNLFATKSLKKRLMLLWILPHFTRRVRGQDKKNTLPLSEVKQSGKLLLPLIDADLPPEIW